MTITLLPRYLARPIAQILGRPSRHHATLGIPFCAPMASTSKSELFHIHLPRTSAISDASFGQLAVRNEPNESRFNQVRDLSIKVMNRASNKLGFAVTPYSQALSLRQRFGARCPLFP